MQFFKMILGTLAPDTVSDYEVQLDLDVQNLQEIEQQMSIGI